MSQFDPNLSDIAQKFDQNLTLHDDNLHDYQHYDEEEEDDDDQSQFEFTFAEGDVSSPVSADEVFQDGQIRPFFPFSAENAAGTSGETTSYGPHVRKMFVVSSSPENDGDVAEGPYCSWSPDNSPPPSSPAREMSKKSNSTGLSKFWRVKDLLVRSNSDGKDAFVFLKDTAGVSTSKAVAEEEKGKKKMRLRRIRVGRSESETARTVGEKEKKKGKKKSAATAAETAYGELYGKKKGGGKSYLPYRQDLVGFFTNSSAGLSRNVHPY